MGKNDKKGGSKDKGKGKEKAKAGSSISRDTAKDGGKGKEKEAANLSRRYDPIRETTYERSESASFSRSKYPQKAVSVEETLSSDPTAAVRQAR